MSNIIPVSAITQFSTLRKYSGLSWEELEQATGLTRRTLARYESGESTPKPLVLELLKAAIQASKSLSDGSSRFKFIDLFAGIGGLRRGFDRLGGECVFTSEWNGFAQQTYLANYSPSADHIMAGDITAVSEGDIPAHDLLLAGFPCQPFSIAGVSKKNSLGRNHGFACEAQGTLFFDVARIIKYHRPKVFLLENVKNLLNHDKGNTFRVIHETLTKELGYSVSWRVIDAKSFVPQHRERIFIVGTRDDANLNLNDIAIPSPLEGPKLRSILHPEDGSEESDGRFTTGPKAKVADKYTLTDNLWSYLQAYAAKHKAAGNGFGFGLCGPDDVARTLSARYYKDGSEILISRGKNKNPRRLTPRECARLMGFDRPNGSSFKIPVSDTQAYRQFGNAVVVDVVNAVADHIAPLLLPADKASAFSQMKLAI